MLDKKKIWAKFLFKFKCVIKQQRQLSTSTTYLTQELLANVQWSGSSRSFAKKTRALKMRGIVASHQILTTINWEGHQNWCSENYRRSCRGTHINHSTVIQHLKQTGKVKKLNKWAPYEVTTNQKNHFSVSCSFILCNNNEPFLNWIVTCDENWIIYNNWWRPAQWLDREEALRHFTKPNLYQKSSGSLFGTLRLIWHTTAFWILAKGFSTSEQYTQQIDELHQKRQCLQAILVNRNGPIILQDNTQLQTTQPTLQKLNELSYKVLPHLPFSPDLLPPDYYIFKHLLTSFCRENTSTTSKRQKMISKSLSNPVAQIFTLQE